MYILPSFATCKQMRSWQKTCSGFFKIVLLSSVIYTNDNIEIVEQFLKLKSFEEKFRLLNFTNNGVPRWPIISSCFRKSVIDDEVYSDCKVPSTTLTPLGICSSFNSLSHNQIYSETDHSKAFV